jgi:hypothetical protein
MTAICCVALILVAAAYEHVRLAPRMSRALHLDVLRPPEPRGLLPIWVICRPYQGKIVVLRPKTPRRRNDHLEVYGKEGRAFEKLLTGGSGL